MLFLLTVCAIEDETVRRSGWTLLETKSGSRNVSKTRLTNKHLNYNFIMSTRGNEYARNKKDKYGNVVPEVVIPMIYQKNYRHQTKKNRHGN